jgi:ABC-type bacteriocin/lantibiotic exporter with double-glycine peptidase domain
VTLVNRRYSQGNLLHFLLTIFEKLVTFPITGIVMSVLVIYNRVVVAAKFNTIKTVSPALCLFYLLNVLGTMAQPIDGHLGRYATVKTACKEYPSGIAFC